MTLPKSKQNIKMLGLSLIELMIVVAIIGILAAIAVPKFKAFKARSYRAEAYTSLYTIHTLQGTYHADYDTYSELSDVGYSVTTGSSDPVIDCNAPNGLGFNLTDCRKARFRFRTTGTPTDVEFIGNATAEPGDGSSLNKVYPNCTVFDEISINQGRATNTIADSIAECG